MQLILTPYRHHELSVLLHQHLICQIFDKGKLGGAAAEGFNSVSCSRCVAKEEDSRGRCRSSAVLTRSWTLSQRSALCTGHTLVMWPRWSARAFIFMSALSRTSVARLRALADCRPLALILPLMLIIGPDKYSLSHLSS